MSMKTTAANNADLTKKLVNDIYSEVGTISKPTHEAVDYLMRHGWIRTPEEAEAAMRGQAPGRTTITESQYSAATRYMNAGDKATFDAGMNLAGALVVPNPEPTNAEKLQDAVDEWEESGDRCSLADWLDRNGWTKVGDDDE